MFEQCIAGESKRVSKGHGPKRPTNFFVLPKNRFGDKLTDSSGCDNAKRFSASGGFAPDQGLCPWTSLGAAPQTPIIGSRSVFMMCFQTLARVSYRIVTSTKE